MSPRATTWRMRRHTLAKHELMRTYLDAWFPIHTIQGHQERVIFLDGFAGPGIYDGGELGSPLIALEALINHASFPRLAATTFEFIFVERREDRFERLKSELNGFWSQREDGQPPNIHVRAHNDEFVTVVHNVMPYIQQSVPTFAFIDPFGWSQAPMPVIRDMLGFEKCEVLVTFMSEYVNRFLTHPDASLRYSLDELFGTNDYRQATDLTGDERKWFLRDLYVRQLREEAGFRFAKPFEVRDLGRGTRTMYFLMFGTHHIRGLDRMKTAMWKLDPERGVLFAGLTGGDPLLFEPEPDVSPLEVALRDCFTGQAVRIEDIEEFVITDTDYTSSHYKPILKRIEAQGLIEGVSGRTRRNTYPPGTVLRFLRSGTPTSTQLSLGDF